MFELGPADSQVVSEYAAKLTENLVAVVGAALKDLSPAGLSFGNGRATFAINRREPPPSGVKIGENPQGPTDPDVPVLKISRARRQTPRRFVRLRLPQHHAHRRVLQDQR